jgi:hypothetical protein
MAWDRIFKGSWNVWNRITWAIDTLWYNAVDLIFRDLISKSACFVYVSGWFLWLVIHKMLTPDTNSSGAMVGLNAILVLFVTVHVLAWILFVQKKMAPLVLKAFCVLVSMGKLTSKDLEAPEENDDHVKPEEKPKDVDDDIPTAKP